ncbi:TonB-dependent receptor [Halioxenophilus sp. WMMB6]|uniref:TonB-dependent receptor n=1 Tax=Halioxenophilus sp. WMMB6 TaxID=3073815 RepID=UPI00295F3487|nr:TonB-dependent receptor [Halioxenophilus sp. WMMB6]
MKRSLINGLAASALVLSSLTAKAADELVIYVFKDGEAAADVSVVLDGQTQKPLKQGGVATFDLGEGGHSVQLIQNGQTIHSFRFDSALGQLTDINVALSAASKPKVAIESFYKTETATEKAKAPAGFLQGQINSAGSPVAGAEITVDGTSYSAISDENGRYELELPRGLYNLSITHPDMRMVEAKDVRVVSNVTKGLMLTMRAKSESSPSLSVAMPQIEEVTVLAKYNPNAFGESERFSANVLDTLGIEQLARFGDSEVSASVVRLPSVTIQDDSFVFIRGLGGRYVTTTLNGATMPSTNPNRRSVPLDLFPSNIVSQLDVKKTFLSEMPGESTGGNLVINTRTFPDEGAGKLSFKLGYTDGLTGDTVYSDPSSGDFDYLGVDDGSRREPLDVEAISIVLDPVLQLGLDPTTDDGHALGNDFDVLSDQVKTQLRQVAALRLTDGLDLDTTTATPKVSLGGNFGDLFYIGESELGYFGAVNYKSGWAQKTDGVSRTYSASGRDVRDDFAFEESALQVDVSALLSVGLNVGNNSYTSNSIVSRVTENSVRVKDGDDGDSGKTVYGYSIDWEERQYLSEQVTGEHFLDDAGDFTTEWQATVSQTRRYAPDRREVLFTEEVVGQPYSLTLSNLLRRFDDMYEYNYDVSNNYDWTISSGGDFDQTAKFGWQYIYRERDSKSSTYGLTYTGSDPDFDLAENRLVSDVVNQDNITGDPATGLAFIDRTLASDSYKSDMTMTNAFLSYDLLLNSQFQFVLGVRWEDFEMETNTFNLTTGEPTGKDSPLEDDVWLPSINFNWLYSEQQQIRLAFSKTVSRPDFKERSNATFYDKELDARVRGNPQLAISEVLNADLRWEYYWNDTENVSVAFFYKDFSDPIERIVQTASGTAGNTRTFENAVDGQLSGVEVDGRIDFALNESLSQSLFVAGNVSLIDSEVTTLDGKTADFQGAPEYTFNLILGWDDLANDQELTVLFNQNGKTVIDRGVSGRADIVKEPIADLNINYKKGFAEDFNFSMKLKNILNSDVELTQDGKIYQSYKKGVEFEAGIDWNF